jgi:hypothetical protein
MSSRGIPVSSDGNSAAILHQIVSNFLKNPDDSNLHYDDDVKEEYADRNIRNGEKVTMPATMIRII